MIRSISQLIDASRIWHKVTFQRGRILKTESAVWETFDDPEHFVDPRGFYAADGRVPQVTLGPPRATRLADVRRFSFPTLHRIEGYPYAETNVATGRIYLLRNAPSAPVAVLSHGWAHDDVRPVELAYVQPLLRAGYSVALPAHSFHFERTPAGAASGELMVSGDVVLTVEAFRQAVVDLCGLVSWLRGGGHRTVGLIGYSLGGYLAGLAACLRGDLEFVVVGGAGDSVVSPILDTRLGVNVREDLTASGMHERAKLERAWGIISPGRFKPRVAKERVLLIAGSWDRIMLAESVARLWEAWGRPPVKWEKQGHYTLLAVPGRLVRRSLPFLSRWAPGAAVPA